jgi:hypothetical protein
VTQDSVVDHRRIQRIAATREGRPAFWLSRADGRLPLYDLSLEGFALSGSDDYPPGMTIAFVIVRDGDGDRVCGEAEVANRFGGASGRTGFRIVAMSAEDRGRLHAWLAAHVLACASVPISEQDASSVVAGPSIV